MPGHQVILWRWLLCVAAAAAVAEPEEWYTAFVNVSYADPAGGGPRSERCECGRYGEHSPKKEARGVLVLPEGGAAERQACAPGTRFQAPRGGGPWVALVADGNCLHREKIRHAAAQNASAVVVFSLGGGNETFTMAHPATGQLVAIMVPGPTGLHLVSLLDANVSVAMAISVGTRNLQKYVSRTSVVFVSISFIVLMIVSLAWLLFYYVQRFRYASARDRTQRRLGDAAKKAMSKLPVRTIRRGDQETQPDSDHCAVCLEGYKPAEVVRTLPCRHVFHKVCVDPWLLEHRTCPMCKMNILKALGITLNADLLDEPLDYDLPLVGMGGMGQEGGVPSEAQDLGVRRVGLPRDYQDPEPLRDSPVTMTTDTHTGELQPMVSSVSAASLVIAVETGLSEEEVGEGSLEQSPLDES